MPVSDLIQLMQSGANKVGSALSSANNSPTERLRLLSENARFGPNYANAMAANDNDARKSARTNYKLRLWNDDNIVFEHWLPESFDFDLSSEWASPYANTAANMLQGSAAGIAVDLIGASSGHTPRFRFTSQQFWQGNSHVGFQFNFQMRAEKDPVTELIVPFLTLVALALPAEDENKMMLIAPATSKAISYTGDLTDLLQDVTGGDFGLDDLSSIASNLKLGGSLHLGIGNMMRIEDVIIKSIHPTFPTRFDASGMPLEMDMAVGFETRFTPTVQELLRWFQGNKQGGP